MSETYTYGRGLKSERSEYRTINDGERRLNVRQVSDELESLFENMSQSRAAAYIFEQNDEGSYRKITSSYITHDASVLVYDIENGLVEEHQSVIGNADLKIEHAQYVQGVVREEYIMKIEQNDPMVKGTFSTRYHFSHYTGGVWQASVEHIDVENDDWNMLRVQNNSKFYTRDMTPYDFDEFFKDTSEIKTQLGIGLVQ